MSGPSISVPLLPVHWRISTCNGLASAYNVSLSLSARTGASCDGVDVPLSPTCAWLAHEWLEGDPRSSILSQARFTLPVGVFLSAFVLRLPFVYLCWGTLEAIGRLPSALFFRCLRWLGSPRGFQAIICVLLLYGVTRASAAPVSHAADDWPAVLRPHSHDAQYAWEIITYIATGTSAWWLTDATATRSLGGYLASAIISAALLARSHDRLATVYLRNIC